MRHRPTLCLLAVLAIPAPSAAQSTAPLAPVAWLAGCHELRRGARLTHEQWMAPLGGMMMGMSRTVVRDTTREFEALRIEARGADVFYIALPSGQAEARFTATVISDTLVAFEDPTHDFPQRISYRAAGADSVIARIEGTSNGQRRAIDFPFRRVACGR